MGCCAHSEAGMPAMQKSAIATAKNADPEADYPLRSGTYNIKHQYKEEYLYVGEPRFDDNKKHVLAWTCGEVDDSMKFIIKAHDNGAWYTIEAHRWNQFVYAADELYTENKRRVLMYEGNSETNQAMMDQLAMAGCLAFRWQIKKVNDEWFEITSVEFGTNMYLGDPSLDDSRRLTLLWGANDMDSIYDPCQRWTFEKVE